MKSFLFSTKGKVITGFGLAVLGLITALYFSIVSFREISVATTALARPNYTQLYLNQLLAHSSEAESQVRAYTLTLDPAYLTNYEQKTSSIFTTLDTLEYIARKQKSPVAPIDSLRRLMENKVTKLNEFMSLKVENDERTFSELAIRQLNKQATDSVAIKKALKKTETEISEAQPSLPRVEMKEEERKGLLSRLFGRSKKEPKLVQPDSQVVTTSSTVSVDTIVVAQAVSDTVMQRMQQLLTQLQREETIRRRQLTDRELTLLKEDNAIMQRIGAMVRTLEHAEVVKTRNQANEARKLSEDASLLIFMLSCMGLLSSFIFLGLIIRDISRSNYYKKRLELAKQRAEELSQVKAHFLANMSHEIRTPLHAILGFSEQLSQQASLPQAQAEQLEVIRSSSGFLLSLVNDILDLSKIEAGKLRFEQKPFALKDTLEHTIRMMKPRAEQKGLKLQVFLPEDEFYLTGDPYRLQQILFNLLSNAIKFTEEGAVRLICSAADNGFGKAVVRMQIVDTGIGIPKDRLNQVFDNFSQADESVTRRFGGTGLGLSITHKLVKLMGGELELESEVGKGTTFFINLPFSLTEAQELTEQQEVKALAMHHHWPEARVLVADDDPINQKLLQHMLKKFGVHAQFVNNGLEALKLLEESSFDLLLTDIQMPELDGLELVRRLRAKKMTLPVVAVTANALPEDTQHYLNTGMSDTLIKPFNENELYRLLYQHLPEHLRSDSAKEQLKLPQEPKLPQADLTPEEEGDYNLEAFAQFANGDAEALRSFILFFEETLSNNLVQLNELIAHKQLAQAGELAHKMYPSVKQIGASEMADALKSLEKEALLPDGKPKVARIRKLGAEITEAGQPLINYLHRAIRNMQEEPS